MLSALRRVIARHAQFVPTLNKVGLIAVVASCNVAAAAQVTYNLTAQAPLYASNLELLGAVTDLTDVQYWAEYDVYYSAGGTASARFTYDNAAAGFALTDTEAKVGSFVASGSVGWVTVGDGTFDPGISYDPLPPLTDGVSLALANVSFPDFSGFSIGDWSLVAVAASWFGGEFVSEETLPQTLPPPPGYEITALTFFFTNSAGESALISAGGIEVAPVPVPAAAWLFASGLLGLISISRKK